MRAILRAYSENRAIQTPAVLPPGGGKGRKKAVMFPEFRLLAQSFRALYDTARNNRTPGQSAFSAPSPGNASSPGSQLALFGPATPGRRGGQNQSGSNMGQNLAIAGQLMARQYEQHDRTQAHADAMFRELCRSNRTIAQAVETNALAQHTQAVLVAQNAGVPPPAPFARRAALPGPSPRTQALGPRGERRSSSPVEESPNAQRRRPAPLGGPILDADRVLDVTTPRRDRHRDGLPFRPFRDDSAAAQEARRRLLEDDLARRQQLEDDLAALEEMPGRELGA